MKTSLFKLITLGAICASITLVPAFASAQDHHNRGHEKIIRPERRQDDCRPLNRTCRKAPGRLPKLLANQYRRRDSAFERGKPDHVLGPAEASA